MNKSCLREGRKKKVAVAFVDHLGPVSCFGRHVVGRE